MSLQEPEADNTTEILALINLLIRKGVITEEEIVKEIVDQKKRLDNMVLKKFKIKK